MNDGKQFCQRYKTDGTMLLRKDIIDMFTTANNRESYLKPICNKIARNKVNPVKKSKTETDVGQMIEFLKEFPTSVEEKEEAWWFT